MKRKASVLENISYTLDLGLLVEKETTLKDKEGTCALIFCFPLIFMSYLLCTSNVIE